MSDFIHKTSANKSLTRKCWGSLNIYFVLLNNFYKFSEKQDDKKSGISF